MPDTTESNSGTTSVPATVSTHRSAISSLDPELQAISAVVQALETLDPAARGRVIQYVFGKLGLTDFASVTSRESSRMDVLTSSPEAERVTSSRDIRSLKEAKSPRSANEMVAVMGYYLSDVAPLGERKEEFDRNDVKKYFVHAQFPLPHSLSMALVHAKNAGYIDQGSAKGLYRLNPVGHNLVVHSLPSSSGGLSVTSRAARRRTKVSKPSKQSGTRAP